MPNLKKEIKVNLKEIVFSNEEGKSFCDIFIYEPENIEEQTLGNLYIIGEIVDFSENSSYLVNLLASVAKKEFYSNSKRSTMESLEASLHKINSMLSNLAEQGNIDWIGNLNMSCSAYKKGELYLSQTGKIKTILLRDGQATDIGKNITNEKKPHPFKTFTNIASGELENGDLILFATPELFDMFQIEKLKQLSSSLDIEELAEIIQDAIEKNDNIKIIGLLLMKVEEEEKEKITHIEINSHTEDIEKNDIPISQKEFEEQPKVIEKETVQPEKIIDEDEIYIPKKEKEERLSLEDIISEYETEEMESTAKIKEEGTEKKTDNFADLIDKKSKIKFKNLQEKLRKIFIAIKIKTIFPALKIAKKSAKKLINNILKKEKYRSEFSQQTELLSNRKKTVLVAFVLVMFILVGGLIFKNYKNIENKKFNSYASLLIQAKEKIDKADVNSINNSPQTRKYLIEAKDILNARDTSLDNRNNYKNLFGETVALLQKIQKQLDTIDLVVKIENPTIAIDFSQIGKIKNPQKIFENNKKYYVFDSESKSLDNINFSNKDSNDFKIETTSNINLNHFSTSMEKTGEIMFSTNSNKIGIFDIVKKTFLSTNIELSDNISNIKDIYSYSNFIYLLDPSSNQIYKFKRLTNRFSKGQNWLEEKNMHIENAVSMAIDGSIYLLNSDGSIDKFRMGNKEKFSIESPSNPILASAKLYTEPKFRYLYVVDYDNNRIVLFDKTTGKLVRQYVSNKFNDLKNIIVNEKEQEMYILNGDKIFKTEIKK